MPVAGKVIDVPHDAQRSVTPLTRTTVKRSQITYWPPMPSSHIVLRKVSRELATNCFTLCPPLGPSDLGRNALTCACLCRLIGMQCAHFRTEFRRLFPPFIKCVSTV